MSPRIIPVPTWIVAVGIALLVSSVILLDSTLPLSAGLLPTAVAFGLAAASWGYLPYVDHSPRTPRKALPMYGQLRWVAPEDLQFPEAKVWPESDEPLDWMVGSVRLLSVLAPVVAFENRLGQLVVLDGRRRVRAAAMALVGQVPVFVIEAQTPEGQALKQLVLNVAGRAPAPRQVRRMVEILAMMGICAELVATVAGIPEGEVLRICEDAGLSYRGGESL